MYDTTPLQLECSIFYLSTAAFNNCYSGLVSYTALACYYWVSFRNAYQCQGHSHQPYELQLLYNSCRTCLVNHMESILCNIPTLVIKSLGDGDTHTHADVQTETFLRNQAHVDHRSVHAWFKNKYNSIHNYVAT